MGDVDHRLGAWRMSCRRVQRMMIFQEVHSGSIRGREEAGVGGRRVGVVRAIQFSAIHFLAKSCGHSISLSRVQTSSSASRYSTSSTGQWSNPGTRRLVVVSPAGVFVTCVEVGDYIRSSGKELALLVRHF